MKPFEEWTFEELVDYCAGEILKGLIKGEFRDSVFTSSKWIAATGVPEKPVVANRPKPDPRLLDWVGKGS